MDFNDSSSSATTSWGVPITESFKMKGKGAVLVAVLLAISALALTAALYKCFRARSCDAEVDVEAGVEVGVELAARN
ncbi:hypothetical protein PTKIN_Ptkin09bG0025100 [Pterospermum kingtungense]